MYLVVVSFHHAKLFCNTTVDILYLKFRRLCPMTWLADVLSMLLLVRKMLLFRFPSCGQYGAVGISTHEAIQFKQCISWSFHKSVRAF